MAHDTRSFTSAAALEKLDAAGVPAADVRDPDAAVRDPRAVARGETVPRVHPKYGSIAEVYGVGTPIQAPGVGQHNQEVYGQLLGYSAAKIDRLKSGGAI